MVEGGRGHNQIVVFEHNGVLFGCFAHAMDRKRIADAGRTRTQNPLEIGIQGVRAVEVHPIACAAQSQTRQQPWQAKDMVTMHMGDEHPSQLGEAQVAA